MSKPLPVAPSQGNYEIEADTSVKKMLGGDAGIADMFSAQNIERAQKVIDDARDSFFSNTLLALQYLQDDVHRDVPAGEQMGQKELAKVSKYVTSLKGQADALKFTFISNICAHVDSVCTSQKVPGLNYTHLIRDMLDILRIALQNRTVDENSNVARDVIASLNAVSAKIQKQK